MDVDMLESHNNNNYKSGNSGHTRSQIRNVNQTLRQQQNEIRSARKEAQEVVAAYQHTNELLRSRLLASQSTAAGRG